MLFTYKAQDADGRSREGTIDSLNMETAIKALEGRGFSVQSVLPLQDRKGLLQQEITWFQRVKMKDLVILSQQISALAKAQVSMLRIFRMLSEQHENAYLGRVLTDISDDLQGGTSISRALSKYPRVFSPFYINVVAAGEDSGTLSKSFAYLADYLDRNYAIVSKVRSALIYPAFVIVVFIAVMTLILTLVIPRISSILLESGQELPLYTQIVVGVSDFLKNNIGGLLVLLVLLVVVVFQYLRTESGRRVYDDIIIRIPVVGDLYRKFYLTRICDNLATMLGSGITMLQSLEITAEVVENATYQDALQQAAIDVKGGRALSDALSQYEIMPPIIIHMSRVGEESGELASILNMLSDFYRREVDNAVDALISLIEPTMIVLLGAGVGVLIGSVLIPIYNLTSTF